MTINFTFPFTTTNSIPTAHTFRSWVIIFNLRSPMAFCLIAYMPGLAPYINALFWGSGDFQINYANIERLKSYFEMQLITLIRWFYETIWSLRPANVKLHSDPWPISMTFPPIRLYINFRPRCRQPAADSGRRPLIPYWWLTIHCILW